MISNSTLVDTKDTASGVTGFSTTVSGVSGVDSITLGVEVSSVIVFSTSVVSASLSITIVSAGDCESLEPEQPAIKKVLRNSTIVNCIPLIFLQLGMFMDCYLVLTEFLERKHLKDDQVLTLILQYGIYWY